jgi:hypothetical protein
VGLDHGTVRRFARASNVDELLVKATQRTSTLDRFKPCQPTGTRAATIVREKFPVEADTDHDVQVAEQFEERLIQQRRIGLHRDMYLGRDRTQSPHQV